MIAKMKVDHGIRRYRARFCKISWAFLYQGCNNPGLEFANAFSVKVVNSDFIQTDLLPPQLASHFLS
jgi:hypothetical protein